MPSEGVLSYILPGETCRIADRIGKNVLQCSDSETSYVAHIYESADSTLCCWTNPQDNPAYITHPKNNVVTKILHFALKATKPRQANLHLYTGRI